MYHSSKQPGRQNSQVLVSGVTAAVAATSEYRGFALGPLGGDKALYVTVENIKGAASTGTLQFKVSGRCIRKDGTKSASVSLTTSAGSCLQDEAFEVLLTGPVCDEYAVVITSVADDGGGGDATYNAWISA